ncbi:MAG: ADP-ribosylglycohydrolase family protein, partial [Armatimonadota bacterium]
HRSDEAINAALAVAWVIARAAVDELKLDTMVANLLEYVPPCRTLSSIARAQELAADRVPPTKALQELGLSGSAWETVASAFYCWLRNPADLADVLTVAVLGAGDADTRAAIAGAMAGAYLGADAIPQRWARQLDGYQALTALSHRLYETTLEAWHGKHA